MLRGALACGAVLLLAGWLNPIAIGIAAILVLLFSWWIVHSRHAGDTPRHTFGERSAGSKPSDGAEPV